MMNDPKVIENNENRENHKNCNSNKIGIGWVLLMLGGAAVNKIQSVIEVNISVRNKISVQIADKR